MNRVRIETPIENKVTFSESVNRLNIEYKDPIKIDITKYTNEIELFKQGIDTFLVASKTNTKELTVKKKSNEILTMQTN